MYLNVMALCAEITPIACKTAFLESLAKTAGWTIHSNADSSSESKDDTVRESIPVGEEKLPSNAATDGCLGTLSDASPADPGGGGSGGRPPLPNPRSIVRVSDKSVCALSC